ncbi:MAG: Trk system potassium transporter TrkA [Muribaculaceae bacterium]|nr:Trk system potassium transporter TrkA [Muribaculaceae bacterium]
MKIVIAGAGEVGTHLAKLFSNEEQDIIVIDPDERKLALLDSYNLMTYHGSATSFSCLKDVRVGSADIFVAVTPFEARNLMACQLAKSLGAKKTVARIDNSEYLAKKPTAYFQSIGIDYLIYPDYLAASEMMTSLRLPWVRNCFEMFDSQLIVLGVRVRENAPIINHQLKNLSSVSQALHVSAIKRNRETIIPRGDDCILAGDIIYIATTRDRIEEVRLACGKKNLETEKVLIMGGSAMGEQFAKLMGDRHHVKIIESDMARCEALSAALPNCNVVNGDARDTDLLEEEGISDYDVFVALTNNTEANILGCLMAKEHGVGKTIAEVENLQYINEAEALNIGTLINKQLLASSRIVQIMLDCDVDNARCLALSDAEVAELIIKDKARVTRAEVKDLRLPLGMTIAGMVRNGVGQLVRGNTRLQAGDHVVVFCLVGTIHKIEKVFS